MTEVQIILWYKEQQRTPRKFDDLFYEFGIESY